MSQLKPAPDPPARQHSTWVVFILLGPPHMRIKHILFVGLCGLVCLGLGAVIGFQKTSGRLNGAFPCAAVGGILGAIVGAILLHSLSVLLMPLLWLRRRTTVAEIEAGFRQERPAAEWRAEWRALVADLRADDELWEYRSPPSAWEEHAGSQGYAVVRRGTVVKQILTEMS